VKGNRGYDRPVAAVIREITAAKFRRLDPVARPHSRLPGLRRLGHLDQQAGLHVMDIAVDGYAGGDEWVGMERSAHAAKSVHALPHRDRTQALRRSANETSKYLPEAFAHLRPKQ
jgi:hypothetical protein